MLQLIDGTWHCGRNVGLSKAHGALAELRGLLAAWHSDVLAHLTPQAQPEEQAGPHSMTSLKAVWMDSPQGGDHMSHPYAKMLLFYNMTCSENALNESANWDLLIAESK